MSTSGDSEMVGIELAKLNVDPAKTKIGADLKINVFADEDPVSACIRNWGIWEEAETRYIIETLNPGDVAIDIGANIGYFTVVLSSLVGPNGKVIAFEPNDLNYNMLINNVRLNRLTNIQTIKAVVGATCGVARLFEIKSEGHAQHQITTIGSKGPDVERSTLQAQITLDSLRETGIGHVNFIKMDTQGAEPLVLHGGWNLIRANAEHLNMVIEFNGKHMEAQYGIRPKEYYNEILNMGFDGYFIDARDLKIKPIKDFDGLFDVVTTADGISWPKNLYFFDAVFKPGKRKKRVLMGWRRPFPSKMKVI